MSYIYRKGIILIVFLSLLFAVYIGYVNSYNKYIGMDIRPAGDGIYEVTKVDPLGWAYTERIKPGDRVLRVNGQSPDKHPVVARFHQAEQVKELELAEPSGVRRLPVPERAEEGEMMYHTLLPFGIYSVFLLMSLFLLLKKKGDRSASILVLFFLAVSLAYMSAGAHTRKDALGSLLFGVCFLNVPALFIHFTRQYFQRYELNVLSGRIPAALYAVNGVMVLFQMSYFLGPAHLVLDYKYCSAAMLAVFALQALLMVYLLVRAYVRYRTTDCGPILKYFIAGNVLSFFPFIFAYALPKAVLGHGIIPPVFAAMFLFCLPMTFMYLIVAARFYDIDFFIGRLRYYSLLAVFPTAVIVFLQNQVFQGGSPMFVRWIQSAIIVYSGIVVLLYMKELLDHRMRPRLLKPRFDFQASMESFTRSISSAMKADELEERLLKEVREVVAAKQFAVLEMNTALYQIDLRQSWGPPPPEQTLAQLRDEIGDYHTGDLIEVDVGIAVVIGKRKASCYILWAGEKTNRTRYNLDERTWLRTVANYTGVVYDNLQLVEGVIENLEHDLHEAKHVPSWILRLLFSLSEKERRSLAADLHDSALQEQILWYRRMEELAEDERLTGELLEEVIRIKEGLLDVIHEIRETCNELRPPFLMELGLVQALENLFEYAQLRTDYTVTFEQEEFHAEVSGEQLLALYRIVQELLRNAMKHAQATQVHIRLSSDPERIYFHYNDNGIGMDVKDIKTTFQNMGLSGIRERVAALEGEIAFESSAGEGFAVVLSLPLETTSQGMLENTIQVAYG